MISASLSAPEIKKQVVQKRLSMKGKGEWLKKLIRRSMQ